MDASGNQKIKQKRVKMANPAITFSHLKVFLHDLKY